MSLKLTPTSSAENAISPPRITVIGVGGGGGNAVDNMISTDLNHVEFIVANTDAQQLSKSQAPIRLQLGPDLTRGLGAGAKPEIGRQSAEEVEEEIRQHLTGVDLVFITAGMGGGTGTGAAPVMARIARENGALTIGVVSKPFQFEGMRRCRAAEAGIVELQKYVDTLIVIPNQNLFSCSTQTTTLLDAFKMADDVLYQGVRSITDLMVVPGVINLDFADVKTVMGEMGKAMMGTGVVDATTDGPDRATLAAERAISNPLLEESSIRGARGLLINVTGGPELGLYDYTTIMERISEEAHADAEIVSGFLVRDDMAGCIQVSVVATGIDRQPENEPSAEEKAELEDAVATFSQPASQPGPGPAPATPPLMSQTVAQPPEREVPVQRAAVEPRPAAPQPAPGPQPAAAPQRAAYHLASHAPQQTRPVTPPTAPLRQGGEPQERAGLFSRLFRNRPNSAPHTPPASGYAPAQRPAAPAQPREEERHHEGYQEHRSEHHQDHRHDYPESRSEHRHDHHGEGRNERHEHGREHDRGTDDNLDIPAYLRRQ
ncbi:cell division protein FtsZ [Oecophyllibacter saccharovorans]|uniref:cell division protein FtsZ n=1 Tax=Oecophyllibacter saccharovorans TaxID=2558360 RepID=UPI001170B66E|nr:cell division protein FtsZ [Oecophyllibacter saccharovorans]TPW34873.1 cell division protein FtsZ [Oecophyllibacter saccharovorans]